MLVLSRRSNERIVFPAINTRIEVLDIKGDRVRIGIEAPAEIKVLREEIAGTQSAVAGNLAFARKESPQPVFTSEQRHKLRNQLNYASVGLALVSRQLEAGLVDGAESTLEKLREGFEQLGTHLETFIASPPAPRRAQPDKRLTALLVEDDDNECQLLAGFFRLAGYQVVTAGDGGDALNYLQEHEPPDVMLLDMILPRCDGPTTVRMVRRDPALADLKIFAVSGYTPEQVGLDCKTAGVDRWFQKPVNPEVLLQEINATRCLSA